MDCGDVSGVSEFLFGHRRRAGGDQRGMLMRIVFVRPEDNLPEAQEYRFALISHGQVVSCHWLPESAQLAAEVLAQRPLQMVREGEYTFMLVPREKGASR